MGCAEQLLRAGPLAVSHARAEIVWTVKCAAPKPHVPGTLGQISTPFCVGRSDCHHDLQRIQPDVQKDVLLNAIARRRYSQKLLVLADHGHADLARRYRRRVASIRLGNYVAGIRLGNYLGDHQDAEDGPAEGALSRHPSRPPPATALPRGPHRS